MFLLTSPGIKDVKIYTTDKGYDKIAEALEKGELHLNETTVARAAKAYDEHHQIGLIKKLSADQAAMLADSRIMSPETNLTNEQNVLKLLKLS